MNTTIIIPTHNEAESIEITIKKLTMVFTTIPDFNMSILVFDSQSSDNTVNKVKALQQQQPNIHLVTENQKSGLGSAYIQGMTYAIQVLHAHLIFEFDADGSHQPKHIPQMLNMITAGNDVVVGSRYVKGGSICVNWPWYRRWLSRGGNWIARLLLTSRYKDFTSGFRVTKVSFLKKINLNGLLSKQYAYKIHLFWELHKVGANIAEYPIAFIDRTKGKSKLPKNNAIESLYLVIRLRCRELKGYIKMCCCGLVGAAVQITIFNLLLRFTSTTTANIFSIEAAIISNFFMNNRFSFKGYRLKKTSSIKSWFKKLFQFNSLSLCSLLLQVMIMYCGTDLLGHTRLISNLFLVIGIGVGSITNYYFYKTIVWKLKRL